MQPSSSTDRFNQSYSLARLAEHKNDFIGKIDKDIPQLKIEAIDKALKIIRERSTDKLQKSDLDEFHKLASELAHRHIKQQFQELTELAKRHFSMDNPNELCDVHEGTSSISDAFESQLSAILLQSILKAMKEIE